MIFTIPINAYRLGNCFLNPQGEIQTFTPEHFEYMRNMNFAPHNGIKPIEINLNVLTVMRVQLEEISDHLLIVTNIHNADWWFGVIEPRMQLKYLHELQNFYFVQTGKELVYKPANQWQ